MRFAETSFLIRVFQKMYLCQIFTSLRASIQFYITQNPSRLNFIYNISTYKRLQLQLLSKSLSDLLLFQSVSLFNQQFIFFMCLYLQLIPAVIIKIMITVRVTSKQIKQFCTAEIQIKQGFNAQNGDPLYIKFLRNNLIDQLDISECLEFNRCVLGEPQNLIFPNHFLKIQEQISNSNLVGLVTQPYSTTLSAHLKQKRLDQKDAMIIFDQILKAVYSLYQQGFHTRNLRSQHFVLCNKTWKLQSLVYDEKYKHANGVSIDYLWSPRHQAPQCFKKSIFVQEQFQAMLVWNLGAILVEMLLGTHKLSTLQAMESFKGSAFSFEAIGIKQNITNRFTEQLKQTLEYMLHYDPKKRMKLTQLFENKMLSTEVAKHYQANKKNLPASKISIGKSSIRMSGIDAGIEKTLNQVNKTLIEREENKKSALKASGVSSILGDDEFIYELGEISKRIPSKQIHPNFDKNKAPKQLQQAKKTQQPKHLSVAKKQSNIDQIMECTDQNIRKALQIYKSYFDQSQLLIQAIEVIDSLEFINMTTKQVRQLKMLIKYCITFVSLINLNSLAEGFNQNRNILDLDGYVYTAFLNSDQYSAFQKIVNFKREERVLHLEQLRKDITFNKDKPLMSNNPSLSNMLNLNYKQTGFQDIKTSYRFIVKNAYDTIAEQYNQYKKTDMGQKLAQTAMYVTYCLTIDKLYIKDHITDNFKFYFDWMQRQASNYVPLNNFKQYLSEAPKQMLIENSRYILKKYYSI